MGPAKLEIRLTSALFLLQALVIIGLFYWLVREREANPYMGTWASQNSPVLSPLISWTGLYLVSGAILAVVTVRILNLKLGQGPLTPEGTSTPRTLVDVPTGSEAQIMVEQLNVQFLRPFYEFVEIREFVAILALLAQSLALWIVTAGTFTITTLPPDSFYYLSHLPIWYWWGFAATLGLLFAGRVATRRLRTLLEITALLLLAIYVLGLPSFVYATPRILDSYQHAGNTLGLINNGGWVDSPIWYARQFPGAFTFFAQLILIPGIDSFSLMRYYVIGISSIMTLFVYTIAREYSPNYAAASTGLFLGALWFQLHLSPQSLELVLYLGLILVLVKIIENPARSKPWTLIALVTSPVFIVSHPETVILVIPGLVFFLAFIFVKSKMMFRELLPNVGLALAALLGSFLVWWSTFASEARNLIFSVAESAIGSLSSIIYHSARTSIPSSPSYSYKYTITSELGISGAIWILGIVLILLSRLRLLRREALLAGLFTVAVLTVPVTVFVRTDMLARSYLFSLLPAVILFAWLLERRSIFVLRPISLHFAFKAILIVGMIALLALLPLSRNGNDPEELIPQSSLLASNVAGELQHHSVLLINFGEYGYWYYSTLKGGRESPKDEQLNMSNLEGGFIEANSILTRFDLNLTTADASSNYILLSNYYENLYVLRYGPTASYYLGQTAEFESEVSMEFNLVYSTGTDHIYANQNLN